MKTTDYGDAGGTNQYGIDKPAKDVDFLHSPGAALTGTKAPVSDSTIRDLVTEFYRIHGCKPTKLHLDHDSGHYRARGLNVKGIGFVMLDFHYEAAETHLE